MKKTLRIENLVVNGKSDSGWFPIVQGISLEVKPGEVVALIGESGAGKTTVALSALGYSRPGTRIMQGRVNLGTIDLLALDPRERRKLRGAKVAYVAQSAAAAFNPAMTLGGQITEGIRVHGLASPDAARKRVSMLLELLDLTGPGDIARRFPHQMSGGQQQRGMVAMAMACMPEFLVFDEPTTALDVTTQIEVLKAIKAVIRQNGTGAIYVSHDLSVVAQIADRIIVMHGGRLVEEGQTAHILRKPGKEHTIKLLQAVRSVPDDPAVFAPCKPKGKKGRAPVLMIRDVRAGYGGRSWLHFPKGEGTVLHGVNFSIHSGEVLALVGESGSGKSTMARVIAGLLPPSSGEVLFQGATLHPLVRGRSLEQLRKIQIVFQNPDTTLNPGQRVAQAIGRPLELYFGLKGRRKYDRVAELLRMVGLGPEYAYRYPSDLSGGEKQRVSLARAFAAKPELILCDEVLSALDTVVGTTILNLLRDLQSRLGVACLFISHDLATVSTIADRVIVLYAGRVCEIGPTAKVFSPPYHPYTDLLMSSIPELRCGWLEDTLLSKVSVKDISDKAAPGNSGCAFRFRCPYYAGTVCDLHTPGTKHVSKDHVIFCHREIRDLAAVEPNGDGIAATLN